MQVVYIQKLKFGHERSKKSISFSSMVKNNQSHFRSNLFFQNRQSCNLMEITFWSIPRVLFELQRHTIRHFKGNLIIKNYFLYHKALWRKIKAPALKTSVYFFLGHPLYRAEIQVGPWDSRAYLAMVAALTNSALRIGHIAA